MRFFPGRLLAAAVAVAVAAADGSRCRAKTEKRIYDADVVSMGTEREREIERERVSADRKKRPRCWLKVAAAPPNRAAGACVSHAFGVYTDVCHETTSGDGCANPPPVQYVRHNPCTRIYWYLSAFFMRSLVCWVPIGCSVCVGLTPRWIVPPIPLGCASSSNVTPGYGDIDVGLAPAHIVKRQQHRPTTMRQPGAI